MSSLFQYLNLSVLNACTNSLRKHNGKNHEESIKSYCSVFLRSLSSSYSWSCIQSMRYTIYSSWNISSGTSSDFLRWNRIIG